MRFMNQSSARKRIHRMSETIDSRYKPEEIDEDHIEPHILSNEEIMVKYWKLMVQKICNEAISYVKLIHPFNNFSLNT